MSLYDSNQDGAPKIQASQSIIKKLLTVLLLAVPHALIMISSVISFSRLAAMSSHALLNHANIAFLQLTKFSEDPEDLFLLGTVDVIDSSSSVSSVPPLFHRSNTCALDVFLTTLLDDSSFISIGPMLTL